jgi:hypothetical protein
MNLKRCGGCGEEKPANPDHFIRRRKGGPIGHRCRDCHKATMRIANRETYRTQRPREMVRQHRYNDSKRGLHSDITPEWFAQHIEGAACTYCGANDEPIGMDRIDNNLGHTIANCVPACHTCNKARNNLFSVDEMRLIGTVIAQIKAARLK